MTDANRATEAKFWSHYFIIQGIYTITPWFYMIFYQQHNKLFK